MAAVNKENRLSKPKKLMRIIDMPEYILNQKTDSTYRRCEYLGRVSKVNFYLNFHFYSPRSTGLVCKMFQSDRY